MFTHKPVSEIFELPERIVNGQRWYMTPEGVEYPSNTTVLGDEPKPFLEKWKKRVGKQEAKRIVDKAVDLGKRVHHCAEKYLQNEKIDEYLANNNDIVTLFRQLQPKLNKINNIRGQEICLFSHELRVAGRVDCVGEYEGVLSIVDFKTSKILKREHMILDYFLQCTAYALMYYEMYGEFIEDIVILIACEEGIVPAVFKKKIYDYVPFFTKRVNKFYNKRNLTL